MQAIKSEIEKAYEGSRRLRIDGYRTSDGGVLDYEVVLLPENGYKDMVGASLEKLDSVAFPEDADQDVRDCEEQARGELRASFFKSLGDGHGRTGPVYEYSGKGWWFDAGKEGVVILRGMRRESCKVVSGERSKPVNSKPLTKAKNLIRKQLPIDEYLGQLVLAEEKVASVAAL